MRKKLDNRLRILIENGVELGHRTMFVILGEKARDQVVILHHILSKAQVKARPTVLWCYKNELGFTTHRKKRMRLMQRKIKAGIDVNEDDPLDMFISTTTIRYCYYKETHKILGNTYGMLILQDFEAITPNILARTVETIEGGGVIVILLNTLDSLRQFYTMSMDVHDRYRTEAHQDIVPRFNERFILSMASCKKCVVIDDKLNILPISSHVSSIVSVPKRDADCLPSAEEGKLIKLKESLADTQLVSSLINCCKTFDQAKAVLQFINSISDKTLNATVSLTAARGRGKSAALGLAIAAAVAFDYSNIFVTSPSPENLKTLFEFIIKGFDAVHYKEHLDYEVIQSTNPEFNKCVVRINVLREHRQTIQYIHPSDAAKNKLLGQSAELVVIDEAAAIPLPIVRSLMGSYLVFLSSTINGYEGTGRSLSLKLIDQLRKQNSISSATNSAVGRTLHELELNESIRYRSGDDVEEWLNKLLCLDAAVIEKPLSSGVPDPNECQLYYINRDTLFSFHKSSESFLQRLMALYVASHYKNSPNDLQMISDAPAHHLFCLLPPMKDDKTKHRLPEVLCFVQVCLEGEISNETLMNSLSRGRRAAGDLIPWTVSQQFQDNQFASLSGARIVRIATHPNYQRMGFGARSLRLLEDYYRGKFDVDLLNENVDNDDNGESREGHASDGGNNEDADDIVPRKSLPPLLLDLKERKAERLDWMGVSYGLTVQLLKFWKRAGYIPVYLRQTENELTGEHSCIMLKTLLDEDEPGHDSHVESRNWLTDFWVDFRKRFLSLLSYQFREFASSLALSILDNANASSLNAVKPLDKAEFDFSMSLYDLKRLELYAQNMADYHLIVDLLPTLGRLYFQGRFGADCRLSAVQQAVLVSMGLQHKGVEAITADLGIEASQILGLFNKAVRKLTNFLKGLEEKAVESTMQASNKALANNANQFEPVRQTLRDELEEAADFIRASEKRQYNTLVKDMAQYAIKGTEDDWDKALKGKEKSLVSIKSRLEAKTADESTTGQDLVASSKKQKLKHQKFGKKRSQIPRSKRK